VFHESHVLNKASKDKVMTGCTSGIQKFDSITSQKSVMQALSIIDCPVEPHLLPVLVKVKKIWQNVPATLTCKPMSVISGLAWYVDIKRRRWRIIIITLIIIIIIIISSNICFWNLCFQVYCLFLIL